MIKPTFHRVLVRPLLRETSRGGIIIPGTAKENDEPCLGEVVAIGSGRRPSGHVIDMSVKAGDKVVFRKHAGRHVDLDVGNGAEALRFIAEEDIDAVVEGDVEVVGVAR